MKNAVRFLPLLIAVALLSCRNAPEVSQSTWKLVRGEDLYLNLDKRTAPNENYFQYLEDFRGTESMVFHIRKDRSFKIYDLQSGQLKDDISYPVDGPGALPSVYGFYIHNEDSIFLSQQYHYRILLTDGDLQTIDRFNLIPDGVKFKSSGYLPEEGHTIQTASFLSRSLPFVYHGNFIFPSMYMEYASKRSYTTLGHLFTQYEMKSKDISYKLPYPKAMQNQRWGGMLTPSFSCLNPKTQHIITSYAGYEYISVSRETFDTINYYKATSDKFSSISPASGPFKVEEEEIAHYMNMPTFGGIYYDKFREVYYRIGKFPKPEGYDLYKSDYLDPMANPRDWVIIVLDKDFQKLSEYILRQPEEGVYFENCFVNKNGFYVAYVDYSDEDRLLFKSFVLEETNS